MIDETALSAAVVSIAETSGLRMSPVSIAEDVLLLAEAYSDLSEFEAAVASVKRALEQLVSGKVDAAQLGGDLVDWRSYHFQPSRRQNAKADLRIIFKPNDGAIDVLAFGHRHIPASIYPRTQSRR